MVLQTGSVLSFALLLLRAYLCNHWAMQVWLLYLPSFVVGDENHRDKRQFISVLQCEVSPRTTILLFNAYKGSLDKKVDTDVYVKVVSPTLSAWISCILEFLIIQRPEIVCEGIKLGVVSLTQHFHVPYCLFCWSLSTGKSDLDQILAM